MTCTVIKGLEETMILLDESVPDWTKNPRYGNLISYINNKYGFNELDRELVEKTLRKDPELMRHDESRTIVSGLSAILTLQEKELERNWKKFLDESQN